MTADVPRTSFRDGVPPALSGLKHEFALIAITCSTQMFVQSGLANTVYLLHEIGEQIGVDDFGQLTWLLSAYSLTVGAFVLIAGRLGDVYGHAKLFTYSWIWFGLWSLATGFAVYASRPNNFIGLVILRALQGIGAGGLLPNGSAILGRIYAPGERKNWAFSIFGATAPVGSIVGGVFGVLLAQHVWWPWIYWIQGIGALVAAAMCVLVLPHKHLGPTRANEKIDWLGAFFGVISLMLIIFAFNQGGVVGWKPPYIYVLLIVGVALFGVFLFIEFRCPYAIMPPSIFTRSRAVALVLICVGLGWGAFSVYWMYGVTWLISNGNSPLLSVAKISPVAVTGVLATIVVAVLIHRIRAHWIFMGAMLAFFASNLLLATMPENQSYWYNFFWAVVVAPFGMDMSFPASGIILSNIVSKHEQGIAQSLVNTVVNLSIALTLGVAGTSQVYLVQAGHSLNYSFKAQFWLGAAMGAVGLIISMFIRVPRGDGSKYLAKEAIDPDAKEDRDLTAELPAAGLPADSEAGTAHDLKGLSEKEAA